MHALIERLSATVRQSLAESAAHLRRQAVISALVVLFGLIAFGFGLAALAIVAAETFGAAMAMLVIAAGALVLAVFALVALKLEKRREERRRLRRATYASAGASLGPALAPMLFKSPALLLAAVAGGGAYFLVSSRLGGRSDGRDRDARASDDPVRQRDAVNPRMPNGYYRTGPGAEREERP